MGGSAEEDGAQSPLTVRDNCFANQTTVRRFAFPSVTNSLVVLFLVLSPGCQRP